MGFKFHHSVKMTYFWIPGVLGISLLVSLLWVNSITTISIALGGDVMLARDSVPIITDSSSFGEALPVLLEADLAAANLESPLAYSTPTSSIFAGYNLCTSSSNTAMLRDTGFDAMVIQNNHTFDCNATGDLETQKGLAEIGIKALGNELNVLEVGQEKIAFLAYEDVGQPFDLNNALTDIANARKAADLLIVSLHWGNEYQAGPDASQMGIAQSLADAGVDVIWGHHSHVLQRIEWVKSTASARRTLVIYSLGNLISDQRMLKDTQRTAIIILKVRKGEIIGISITPLVMNMSQNQLQLADPDQRQLIFERLNWGPETGKIGNIK